MKHRKGAATRLEFVKKEFNIGENIQTRTHLMMVLFDTPF
jgi:hypothetical protein